VKVCKLIGVYNH